MQRALLPAPAIRCVLPRPSECSGALLARNDVDPATVDTYLDTLRAQGRMRVGLTAKDVLAGDLGPWA